MRHLRTNTSNYTSNWVCPFAESGSPAVWNVYYPGRLRVHVFLRSVKAKFFSVVCAKIARFLNEVRGSGL